MKSVVKESKIEMKLANKGFTLVEVLLAGAILAFCLCGLLLTYINMFILSDLARDLTLATNAVQAKMEEIKKTSYAGLSTFNGVTFDIAGFASSDAKGVVEVTDNLGYADLTRVRIVSSLKSRGRIIGEDQDLDGVLDFGEDANGNGRLDSPIELVTLIAQ